MKEHEIQISMDGKDRATDNAITERFFRNLKWERIYYDSYHKPKEVYRAVRTYIEEYKNIRPHQALGYETPASIYYGLISSAGAI